MGRPRWGPQLEQLEQLEVSRARVRRGRRRTGCSPWRWPRVRGWRPGSPPPRLGTGTRAAGCSEARQSSHYIPVYEFILRAYIYLKVLKILSKYIYTDI